MINKSKRGNAYIMVMIISLVMLTMVSSAMFISVRSRDITARYEYFINLYDLAVAGNNFALTFLNNQLEYIILTSEESITHEFFAQTIIPMLYDALTRDFGTAHSFEELVVFSFLPARGVDVQDSYTISTQVNTLDSSFTVTTTSRKITTSPNIPHAIIQSKIVFNLDLYRLEMVELMRIAN